MWPLLIVSSGRKMRIRIASPQVEVAINFVLLARDKFFYRRGHRSNFYTRQIYNILSVEIIVEFDNLTCMFIAFLLKII